MSLEALKNSFGHSLGLVVESASIDPNKVASINKSLQAMVERTKGCSEPVGVPLTDLYDIALRFLRSERLDEYELSCLGASINMPIKEKGGERIVSSPQLSELLSLYRLRINSGDLLIGAWWRLFQAYFNITIDEAKSIPDENKSQLCQFLEATYNKVNQSDTYVPDWLEVLHLHKNILTSNPCSRYAASVLEGDRSEVSEMSAKVKIPDQSWFWHRLMLSVVHEAKSKKDEEFKAIIPSLLTYIDKYNGYRDLALREILKRYYNCSNRERHDELCRYVIRKRIWGSPEFRSSNSGSKWHQVDDSLFRMVLSWVNKEKLRLFFEKLTERCETDKSRFKFWSQYEKQICDEGLVVLVIGKRTVALAKHDNDLKKVIGEDGTFAYLDSSVQELDAIIMQIRDKVIVDFTMTGNAGYVYSSSNLPFSLSAKRHGGGTGPKELKAGYNRSPQPPRIMHNSGWEARTKDILMQAGIFPDR